MPREGCSSASHDRQRRALPRAEVALRTVFTNPARCVKSVFHSIITLQNRQTVYVLLSYPVWHHRSLAVHICNGGGCLHAQCAEFESNFSASLGHFWQGICGLFIWNDIWLQSASRALFPDHLPNNSSLLLGLILPQELSTIPLSSFHSVSFFYCHTSGFHPHAQNFQFFSPVQTSCFCHAEINSGI